MSQVKFFNLFFTSFFPPVLLFSYFFPFFLPFFLFLFLSSPFLSFSYFLSFFSLRFLINLEFSSLSWFLSKSKIILPCWLSEIGVCHNSSSYNLWHRQQKGVYHTSTCFIWSPIAHRDVYIVPWILIAFSCPIWKASKNHNGKIIFLLSISLLLQTIPLFFFYFFFSSFSPLFFPFIPSRLKSFPICF